MSNKSLRILVLFLAFWITGGQWLVLQSVAWVNMIHDYSRQNSLHEAICQTFDGKHPCKFCRMIEQQRAAEEKSSKPIDLKIEKLNFLPASTTGLPVVFVNLGSSNVKTEIWKEWLQTPLSPPPKTA